MIAVKILQVVHGFPPHDRGGTEIATYNLSKELNKNHEVFVFYPVADSIRKPYSLSCGSRNGLEIIEINKHENILRKGLHLLNLEHTYKNKKIDAKFEEVLEEVKPNVVHFQHLIGLSASLIPLVKKRDIPAFLTLHDYWFMCPQIQLFNQNFNVCGGPNRKSTNCQECYLDQTLCSISDKLKFKPIENRFAKNFSSLFLDKKNFSRRNEYLRETLEEVTLLIAPSKFLLGKFVVYGIPEGKIIYSPHGIDFEVFRGFKKKSSDKLRFGFVGYVAVHKGVHVLIEAFNKIKSSNVELKIYGSYDPHSEYFRSLKQKSKNPNIRFMGEFDDVKEPYSEIDVLVIPSIWQETGGPMVLKEAFATKTPVIGSNVGSIPEFLRDSREGFLFKKGNSTDLYEKMHKFITNSELVKKYSKNIKTPRSIKEQTKELEKLYWTAQSGKP